MTQKPEVHQEESYEITDAEEAVFEALLPVYLAGKLDIEKVRQVSRPVAWLLENIRAGLDDAEHGRFHTLEEFHRIMAEDD